MSTRTTPSLRQWMSPVPRSIGREQPLAVAHRLMEEHQLRHLPVLEKGKLVGMLSQRDLYFLETIRGVDIERERVEEGMTPEVYCVPSSTPVAEVTREMIENRYGCAVIVDQGKVAGIFTTTDALRLLASMLESAESARSERTG